MNRLKKAIKTVLCATVLTAMLAPSMAQLAEAKGKSHHHHHSSSSRGRSYNSGSSGYVMTPYGPMRKSQMYRPQLQFGQQFGLQFTGQPGGF